MKSIILVVVALVAVAAAAPPPYVDILRSDFDKQPDGSYQISFETSDGTSRAEQGEVKIVQDEDNKPRPVITVRGSYSYIDPDNKVQTINYIADEFGYKAEGDAIPKPPSRR